MQSAYIKCNSTKTALLRVCNDIRFALDRSEGTLVVVLDLTSAFDTIDYTVLLNRLSKRYGIQRAGSYLQDCKQRFVNGTNSEHCILNGVLHGCILVHVLFSLCIKLIGDGIIKHGVKCYQYADDMQLVYAFALNLTALQEVIQRLQTCAKDIR